MIMLFYNEKIFKRCFDWRGKYWYKNIKEIPLYFKLMHHLIKYGYDEYATWETFGWFIDTMQEVLTVYRNTHNGYPIRHEDECNWDELAKKYDADLDRMIELLGLMDEDNPKYIDSYPENLKSFEEMNVAKDEFFKLFAQYFYTLWD